MRVQLVDLFRLQKAGSRLLAEPLLRSSVVLVANGAISAVLGFAFFAVAARLYSPYDVGIVTATFSAANFIAMASMLGLHIGVLRFLPQEADKPRMVQSVFTVSTALAAVTMAIFLAGIPLWSPKLIVLTRDPVLALSAVGLGVSTAAMTTSYHIFIGLGHPREAFLQQMLFSVARIGLVVVVAGAGLSGLLGGWTIANIVAVVAGGLFLWRVLPGLRPVLTLDRAAVGKMARFSLVSMVAEFLSGAPTFLLPLLVTNLLDPASNAFFFVAFALVSRAAFMLPYVVGLTLLAEGGRRPEEFRHLVVKAAGLCTALIVPAIILVFLFGGTILGVFGAQYSEKSLHVLWALLPSAIPIALIEVSIGAYRVLLKLKTTLLIYGLQMVAIVAFSAGLMSRFGIVGAGVGWTIGSALTALIVLPFLGREMKKWRPTTAAESTTGQPISAR